MVAYTYYNIFETKGIEYLIVIGFFSILIPFWLYLVRESGKTPKAAKLRRISAGEFLVPQGIFFSRNHTWAHLDKNGIASIGLDDMVQHVTGVAKISPLKREGEIVRRGDLISELTSNGNKLKIYSPISGEITRVNDMLTGSPELFNHDPYGEGWFYRVKPSSWKEETGAFVLAEEAVDWVSLEHGRLKDFLSASTMKHSALATELVLQDGGMPSVSILNTMPEGVWDEFQNEFLEF